MSDNQPCDMQHAAARESKIAQANQAWRKLLGNMLQEGFFGAAKMTAHIEDGKITTIRTAEEQTHK